MTRRLWFALALLLCARPGCAADLKARSWDILTWSLTNSDPAKRAGAVAAMGSIGLTSRALSAVEGALDDKDPFVRETAAVTLADMKARRSIPKLRKALQDDSAEVRFAAAKSLWEMGDRSGRDILTGVLSGEEKSSGSFVQAEVREAKRDLHNRAGMAMFAVREGAGTLFGPLGMGVGFAEDYFKDKGAPARAVAAGLLAKDGAPDTFEDLEQALEDRNSLVRAAAAKALGQRGSRSAIPKLEPLLDDKSTAARCMAAAAIIRLSSRRHHK